MNFSNIWTSKVQISSYIVCQFQAGTFEILMSSAWFKFLIIKNIFFLFQFNFTKYPLHPFLSTTIECLVNDCKFRKFQHLVHSTYQRIFIPKIWRANELSSKHYWRRSNEFWDDEKSAYCSAYRYCIKIWSRRQWSRRIVWFQWSRHPSIYLLREIFFVLNKNLLSVFA